MRKISLFLSVAKPEAQEVSGTFTYGTDESPNSNCKDTGEEHSYLRNR